MKKSESGREKNSQHLLVFMSGVFCVMGVASAICKSMLEANLAQVPTP